MAKFNHEQIEGLEDRFFLRIDDRYEIAVIRTDEGLIQDIWPIEDGQTWDHPYDSFQVFDNDATTDQESAETTGVTI